MMQGSFGQIIGDEKLGVCFKLILDAFPNGGYDDLKYCAQLETTDGASKLFSYQLRLGTSAVIFHLGLELLSNIIFNCLQGSSG